MLVKSYTTGYGFILPDLDDLRNVFKEYPEDMEGRPEILLTNQYLCIIQQLFLRRGSLGELKLFRMIS